MKAIATCVLATLVLACAARPAAHDPGDADADADARSEPEQGRAVTVAVTEAEAEAEAATTADVPSFALMQTICAHDCGGPSARVAVFVDARGELARLRFDGDLGSCSHPPRIYFDAAGDQTLTIPMRPLVAGSAEAEALAAEQNAQTEGLRESETLSCFDPARCAPARSEGFRSSFACRSDSDCVACACAPVDRDEWARRGGAEACNIAGEECVATNPACCDGRCVLAR